MYERGRPRGSPWPTSTRWSEYLPVRAKAVTRGTPCARLAVSTGGLGTTGPAAEPSGGHQRPCLAAPRSSETTLGVRSIDPRTCLSHPCRLQGHLGRENVRDCLDGGLQADMRSMCVEEPALVPLAKFLAASACQPMTRFEGASSPPAMLSYSSPNSAPSAPGHLCEQLPSGRHPALGQFRLSGLVVQRPVKRLSTSSARARACSRVTRGSRAPVRSALHRGHSCPVGVTPLLGPT